MGVFSSCDKLGFSIVSIEHVQYLSYYVEAPYLSSLTSKFYCKNEVSLHSEWIKKDKPSHDGK